VLGCAATRLQKTWSAMTGSLREKDAEEKGEDRKEPISKKTGGRTKEHHPEPKGDDGIEEKEQPFGNGTGFAGRPSACDWLSLR